MRRRVAVRPCPGIGEAVRGIAGWRAGMGEQGGTGSIPYFRYVLCLFSPCVVFIFAMCFCLLFNIH